jgi:hypothetical protein
MCNTLLSYNYDNKTRKNITTLEVYVGIVQIKYILHRSSLNR